MRSGGNGRENLVWATIQPEAPLILGDVRGDSQFLSSRLYIPAGVIRGAWASGLARQGYETAEILRAVAQLRVGNFFPAPQWGALRYALPAPMSAMTCKRKGGFRTEPHPERRGHGVVDTLLPRLAYRLLEADGARFPVPFALVCRECGDRMEAFSGFYSVHGDRGRESYVAFRPIFHAQTKVAISRHRRAATEGMLYTASALSPFTIDPEKGGELTQVIFVGRVLAGDEKGQAWSSLKEILNSGLSALGALGTRGYGRVKVEESPLALPSLRERVERFNQQLRALWRDLRGLAVNADVLPSELPDGVYFTVDLLAPGVLRDEYGLPTLQLTLNLEGKALRPLLWLTRPDLASGWSTAWGLPKPTDLAARMGSVYAFRWEGRSEELLPHLETIEREGVGLRREEGFGECLICHPFHLEVEER